MKLMKLVAIGALGIASIVGPAQAQAVDPIYSTHAGFTVHANFQPGRPLVCYASAVAFSSGGRVFDTNILYDGQIWAVAFPSAQFAPTMVGLIVDGRALNFASEPLGDGYNAAVVSPSFIGQLRAGAQFSIRVNGFDNIFSLRGSTAALNDVQACVRNNGTRPIVQPQTGQIQQPAQQPTRPVQPAAPQRNASVQPTPGISGGPASGWNGFDIVGFGLSNEVHYGTARGWHVFSASYNGAHAYCVATFQQNGVNIRLGTDSAQWQLAVPVRSTPDWSGYLEIDGQSAVIAGTAVENWTVAWLARWDVDRLANGSRAILGIGRGDYDFPLAGSAAAILKLEECQQRRGVASAQQPSAPILPAPRQNPASNVAGCPGGERRLPGSGICQSEALAFLPVQAAVGAESFENCPFRVNETPFPGGMYLLYLSEHCPNQPPMTLQYEGGARNAVVWMDFGGGGFAPEPFRGHLAITVVGLDGGDPIASIDQVSRNLMRNDGWGEQDIARCFIQQSRRDRYVFEPSQAYKDSLPNEEPGEWGCGPAGRGDATVYWRVFGGFGWMFDHGQETVTGYEPSSLVLVEPNGAGGWRVVN